MPTLRMTQTFVDSMLDKSERWAKALDKCRDKRERAAAIRKGYVEIWDKALTGFCLKIRKSGKAIWRVSIRHNGKPVAHHPGELELYPEIAAARKAGQASLRKIVEEDRNPAAEEREARQVEETTLGSLLRDYLDNRPKVNKRGRPLAPEYLAEIRRALETDVITTGLGAKPIAAVTTADIKAMLYDMAEKRSSHPRHVYVYLRTAATWLADERERKNFMAGIKPPVPATDRDRALEKDYELRLYWQGCERLGWPFGPLFRLLLLLGPRRDELAESTWDEFDLHRGIWSPGKAKNGRPITVHLSDLAIDILESLPRIHSKAGWVFPQARQRSSKAKLTDNPISGFGNALRRLRTIVNNLADEQGLARVEHFTLHDQRRTIATGMANLDPPVDALVIDKILNPSTGGSAVLSIVGKIYNRAEYLTERRKALDRWSQHIESLVGIEKRDPSVARLHA